MVADRALDVLNRLRHEAEFARLRARNGIRLAAGRQPAHSGLSPKQVIWRSGKTELWRYTSEDAHDEHRPPVLLVHSLVSRSYIFDLHPDNSLISALLGAGADVFLLDWGEPDERDAANTLETYVDDLIPPAVLAVCELTGQPVNVVGYCLGGILSVLYAARHPGPQLATLSTLAAPIDFDQLGMVVGMLRDNRMRIDDLVDETDNIPPEVFRQAFRLMQPMAEATQYINLLQSLWNDDFVGSHQAMSRWVADHIPFPGALARQLTELLIQQNALYRGTLVLGGVPVDLSAIQCPILCVLAERDHIVPISSAEALPKVITTVDCDELRLPAGHVALVIGRLSKSVMVPALMQHFQDRVTAAEGTE